MKQSLRIVFAASGLLALNACYTWQPPQEQRYQGTSLDQGPNRYWSGPNDGPQQPQGQDGTQFADPTQPPPSSPSGDPAQIQTPNGTGGGSNATAGVPTNNPPSKVNPPSTPPTDSKPSNPPPTPTGPQYGIKVPGKPGYIYSPYAKTEGLVDVQGYAPGTKVKCPFTGKVILVP